MRSPVLCNTFATVSLIGRSCRRTSNSSARRPKRRAQFETLITDFRLAVREALHQVNLHSDQMTLAADSLKTIATESRHRAQAAAGSTSEVSSNVITSPAPPKDSRLRLLK